MPNKYKILYIDDELDNLQVFKTTFKNDFDIQTLSSAKNAVEFIKENSFHILLVDNRMPELTGIQFLEDINTMPLDAVRILLTGYSDMQTIVDAINKGHIYFYCTKPWKRDELKAIFLKAIEHYTLIIQNKELLEDLSKTVNELELFIYRASHDLKTPITSQLGLLELLKQDNNELAKIYTGKIEESIMALQSTIDKIQILANLSDHFLKDSYEIDVEGLIRDRLEHFAPQLEARNFEVEIRKGEIKEFFSNKALLQILIDNILDNAISFSVSGSQRRPNIFIDASRDGSNSVII